MPASLLHGGYPHAGKIAGDNIVVVNPVETIDASNRRVDFLGHSYYGDSDSIVSDMFQLFRHNPSPDDRAGLRSRWVQAGKVWFFQ